MCYVLSVGTSNTSEPIILKVYDVIFFGLGKTYNGGSSWKFIVEASTFFYPKIALLYDRDNFEGQKGLGPLVKSLKMPRDMF
jgi:hypothetical protein